MHEKHAGGGGGGGGRLQNLGLTWGLSLTEDSARSLGTESSLIEAPIGSRIGPLMVPNGLGRLPLPRH